MIDINEYVTESEAAKILNLAPGTGNVWRHLRQHAPQIELENIFGFTAVRRDVLETYANGGRQQVEHVSIQRHKAALLRRLQKRGSVSK